MCILKIQFKMQVWKVSTQKHDTVGKLDNIILKTVL